SVTALCLFKLLLLPCRSATSFAMTTPLAFCQGPVPIRSLALTACAPCVLRYACHVRLPAPAAAASAWQCLSAPSRPPKSAPLPDPTLVTKKLMFAACDCAPASIPNPRNAMNATTAQPARVMTILQRCDDG